MTSAKKTLFVKPALKDKENWINGNTGKQKATNAVSRENVIPQNKEEPIKRLTIELKQSVHMAFKIKALRQNKTMLALVREWIEAFVKDQ